jgi:hypothetical protein
MESSPPKSEPMELLMLRFRSECLRPLRTVPANLIQQLLQTKEDLLSRTMTMTNMSRHYIKLNKDCRAFAANYSERKAPIFV